MAPCADDGCTSRRAISVKQHVDGARFSWNTVYSVEEARELTRQVEALLHESSPKK